MSQASLNQASLNQAGLNQAGLTNATPTSFGMRAHEHDARSARATLAPWLGQLEWFVRGRWLRGLLAFGLSVHGLSACDGQGREDPVPSTAAPSSAAEADPSKGADAAQQGPWRFVPTLEQHLPAGAVGEPVLELSQPRQYQVVMLAAVLRAGAEHVELERWTFAQNTDGQTLRLVESGEPIVRLRPGPRSPKLGELRQELAAPGMVLTRPIGLAAPDPFSMLEPLTKALATLRDAKAEPRARVAAAATVVRGLDDTVAFERDAIWELAELLAPLPPAVSPLPAGVEMLSERRARVKLLPDGGKGGTATLELQRKSDGWAITALERQESGGVGTAAQLQ